jgi:hypothetical protein
MLALHADTNAHDGLQSTRARRIITHKFTPISMHKFTPKIFASRHMYIYIYVCIHIQTQTDSLIHNKHACSTYISYI